MIYAIIGTENYICPVGFCCIQRRSEMGIQLNYSVAVYCRLSVDDGTNLESMSIASQKTMLTEYVKKRAGNCLIFMLTMVTVGSILLR